MESGKFSLILAIESAGLCGLRRKVSMFSRCRSLDLMLWFTLEVIACVTG
jgi:hypothetical protein